MTALPAPQCKSSPTGAHYWVCANSHTWQCVYCRKSVILPGSVYGAVQLSVAIKKYGRDKGYRRWLEYFKETGKEYQDSKEFFVEYLRLDRLDYDTAILD